MLFQRLLDGAAATASIMRCVSGIFYRRQVMAVLTVDTGFLRNHQNGKSRACQNTVTFHFLEDITRPLPNTHVNTRKQPDASNPHINGWVSSDILTSSPLTPDECHPCGVNLSPNAHTVPLCLPADLNECGLKPRPCKHRCMNTYGSYKCYCLNGYMLMPDGSCGSESVSCKHTHLCAQHTLQLRPIFWLRQHTK